VFALKKGNDLFLGGSLLGVCGVEGVFGGVNGSAAGFDEVFWEVLDEMW
jgi:hypothetical protein